jgi:hypothetical protein
MASIKTTIPIANKRRLHRPANEKPHFRFNSKVKTIRREQALRKLNGSSHREGIPRRSHQKAFFH